MHVATEFRAKVQHTRNHHARTRSKEGVALKCQFNRGLSLYTAGLGHPERRSKDTADFRLLGLPQIVELICAVINVLQVPVEVLARESARARERERVSHLEYFQDLRTRSYLIDMCNNKILLVPVDVWPRVGRRAKRSVVRRRRFLTNRETKWRKSRGVDAPKIYERQSLLTS